MGEFKKDVSRGEIIGVGTYWIDVEKEDGTKEIDLKITGVSLTVIRTDEQKRRIIESEDFIIYRDETVKTPLPQETYITNLRNYAITKGDKNFRYKKVENGLFGLPLLHNNLTKKLPNDRPLNLHGHMSSPLLQLRKWAKNRSCCLWYKGK